MIHDDTDFARKVAALLDRGVADLKPGTAYRLQLARRAALDRADDPKRSAALELAGAGGSGGTVGGRGGWGGRALWTSARLWIGVAIIVAAGFGYQQWQAYQSLHDLEETDAALLSSDLPIDAYLDRGFQNWLKHASEED
jgi:hypothetical protein